jgi:hypothetical protein
MHRDFLEIVRWTSNRPGMSIPADHGFLYSEPDF